MPNKKMEQHSSSASKQSEPDRFTIMLVEDNFLNRRMVKKALEKNYIIKEAADAETAAEMLLLGKVHLAIIDIHLGDGKNDGIWLGEQVKTKYDIPFIYLTAFGNGDISQRAIFTYPSSYITKPFKEIDLALSIEIALLKYLAGKPLKNNWMLVKDGDYFVKLFTDAIDYFESTGNYLQVLSNGKLFKCRSTIKDILALMPENCFIQTHRAFVVNKNKIEKFNSDSIMVGGSTIPVSLKYANSLLL